MVDFNAEISFLQMKEKAFIHLFPLKQTLHTSDS